MRLREADSMAAMAELRQKVAELEIQVNIPVCVCVCLRFMLILKMCDLLCGEKCLPQKEEGLVKGQLNHSDLRQYINQMKNQITELKNEVGRAHTH